MGLNESHIVNATGHIIHVISFSNSNQLYWSYNSFRQPPVDGRPITMKGLAGGRAVKIGVISNRTDGRLIYDLFRVSHGTTLTIREITKENGVRHVEVQGVELLRLGTSIKAGSDQVESFERGVRAASTITSNAVQVGNLAGMATRAISAITAT